MQAMPRPAPRVAPVTRATFPLSRPMAASLSLLGPRRPLPDRPPGWPLAVDVVPQLHDAARVHLRPRQPQPGRWARGREERYPGAEHHRDDAEPEAGDQPGGPERLEQPGAAEVPRPGDPAPVQL